MIGHIDSGYTVTTKVLDDSTVHLLCKVDEVAFTPKELNLDHPRRLAL
jgi:hypothetical protein